MLSDIFAQFQSRFIPNHSKPGFLDPSTRDAAISAIDKGVGAAMQFVRSLLTCRNTLMPISLLPAEILSRVFHFLALEELPLSEERNVGWIRVTHVCRHWRQVALSDSSLWARISDNGMGIGRDVDTTLIFEMLIRAKNAALEIDLDLMYANPNPMHMFAPHLSHTRALRLCGLDESDSEGVREIFNREAPALEYFELDFYVGSPVTFQDLGRTTLFKGHAPKLRSFCIHQVCIPWSFIPHGQLTQLKIDCRAEPYEGDTPTLGNGRQFIDMLVDCPALEILVLDLCLPNDLSQSSPGRVVHLPRLSRLSIGDSTSRVTDLLKSLRIPSNTVLHLRCISDFGSPDDDYDILPLVFAQFQISAPVEFKSLKVTKYKVNLEIAASASLDPSIVQSSIVPGEGIYSDAEFFLSSFRLVHVGHRRQLLEETRNILPISNLEFLSISGFSTRDPDEPINWAELFKGCTNVTTIQAIGRDTSDFIRALTPATDGSGTSAIPAPGRIIFPNLTSLLLKDLDFTEIKPHSESGVLYELHEVLANVLRQRISTHNVHIKKVHLERCIIPVKRAKGLKKLVTDFRWDKKEN